MRIAALQEQLIEYAKSIGVDKIGFTTASPFHELKIDCAASRSSAFSQGLKNRMLSFERSRFVY